jgi:hypothetical protein
MYWPEILWRAIQSFWTYALGTTLLATFLKTSWNYRHLPHEIANDKRSAGRRIRRSLPEWRFWAILFCLWVIGALLYLPPKLDREKNATIVEEQGRIDELEESRMQPKSVNISQESKEPLSPNTAIVGDNNQITVNTEKEPRRLSGEMKQRFISGLQDYPKGKVTICSPLNDMEAYQFATDLYNALDTAGWSPDILQVVYAKPFSGLRVVIRQEGRQLLGTEGLLLALQGAGLKPGVHLDPTKPDEEPRISIGSNPDGT